MKFIFLLLVVLSHNASATAFRSFEEYKVNNALLSSDIERIEKLASENKKSIYAQTLEQYKLLLASYEKINSQLSLKKFAKDAQDIGWKATAKRADALAPICEGAEMGRTKCLSGLEEFVAFIKGSNLNSENKETIIAFLNDYSRGMSEIAAIDESFIVKFNESSRLLNEDVARSKAASAIVVKLSAPPKVGASFKSRSTWTLIDGRAYTGLAAALVLTGLLGFGRIRKKKSTVQKLYARLFHIGFKNKTKVRVFGAIDHKALPKLKIIEDHLVESLQLAKTFAPETHVKFRTHRNVLKLETVFLSDISLLSYSQKEGELLKEKLSLLCQCVNECGGEMFFTNLFNNGGEITQTSINIHLPFD